MDLTRRAGVLLHPTSLPGPYGIGDLGPEAFRFVDWLAEAGQSLWQVMPLGPTGYGDSPYQCFSAFAGNPLLISLRRLAEAGLLEDAELERAEAQPGPVDYGSVITLRMELLRLAFDAFRRDADEAWKGEFAGFRERFAGWVEDYALFMSLKDFHEGKPWNEWPATHRDRDEASLARLREELAERIDFHAWMQFIFYQHWWAVRHHAAKKGIKLLGDLPIFVAYDSVDVWANRQLFHLDKQGNPTVVAGVPPDYFSETGQLWGNPLYSWDEHRAEDFGWWEARFRTVLEMVDFVRIDHFRGFAACWAVPASEPTAVKGEWWPAPGAELFGTLLGRMGDLPLVAEDLGEITDDVIALRKQFRLPGMKVLQFAWGSGPDNPFLPHNHGPDFVVYTGTHDNNTTVGWREQECTAEMATHMEQYIGHKPEPIELELRRLAYASPAALAVVPMQDLLGLGAQARMNTPGEPAGNWSWRLIEGQLEQELAEALAEQTERYGRRVPPE